MRSDRLVATVLLLQRRGRVTAAEVAAETEVSVATARRDLESLGAAGVPVYPQVGRGGGWQLVGGARTDLTGLTAGEAEALFLLLGPLAGSRPEVRSALAKLVRALPATFRDDAEAAARAVHVEREAWGRPPAGERSEEVLAVVQRAVVRRRVLRIAYAGRGGVVATREVRPLGLVDKGGLWYLVADTDGGRRTFRLDRVGDVEATGETFMPPDDHDLGAAWGATVTAMEERRNSVWARVRAPARLAPVLRSHFGRGCRDVDGGEAAEGVVVLEIGAHTTEGLVEQLAGWALAVEVLGPAEVVDGLAATGRGLVERYGTGVPSPVGPRR